MEKTPNTLWQLQQTKKPPRRCDSLLSSLSQLSISMDVSMLLMADSEPPPPAAPGRSGDSRLLLPPPPPPAVPEPRAPGLSAVGAATWLGESGSEKEDVGDRRGK